MDFKAVNNAQNIQTALNSNALQEAANEQEAIAGNKEVKSQGNTEKPFVEPQQSSFSWGMSQTGPAVIATEKKGTIAAEAKSRRLELENTMVSGYVRSNPKDAGE